MRSALMVTQMMGFLFGILGGCAGVSFEKPEVSLVLKYQDVDSRTQSLLSANSVSSFSSDDDPDDLPASPKNLPREFDPSTLCFVVNATGSGLSRAFFENNVSTSCENAFSGLGSLSQVFSAGDSVPLETSFGERKFELMAFKKEYFGGTCPKKMEAIDGTSGGRFFVDGKAASFEISSEYGPFLLSSSLQKISPGQNIIELTIKRTASQHPVAVPFGCRDFKIFPAANNQDVLHTGMSTMFFKVDCPSDADRIFAVSGGGKTSDPVSCLPTGSAVLPSVELTSDEISAAAWGWYLPKLAIAAWNKKVKVDAHVYKIDYRLGGQYAPLISDRDDNEYRRTVAADEGGFRFGISDIVEGHLAIEYKKGLLSNKHSIDLPVEMHSGSDPLVWTGDAPTDFSSSTLLAGISGALSGDSDSINFEVVTNSLLQLRKCPVSDSASCASSSFAGVSKALVSGQIGGVDGIEALTSGGHRKIAMLSTVDEAVVGELYDLDRQPWVSNGFGAAISKASAAAKFYPPWKGAKLRFVRGLRFPSTPATQDSRLAPRGQVLAGGSREFVDEATGAKTNKSVLYRSVDGGKSWYLVYQGSANAETVDATSIPLVYDSVGDSENSGDASATPNVISHPGFAVLETLPGYDSSGIQVTQVRVLIQNGNGL